MLEQKEAAKDLSVIRRVLDRTYFNIDSIAGLFLIWLICTVAEPIIRTLLYLTETLIKSGMISSGAEHTISNIFEAFLIYIVPVAAYVIYRVKIHQSSGFSRSFLNIWGMCVLLPLLPAVFTAYIIPHFTSYPFSADDIFFRMFRDYLLGGITFGMTYILAMFVSGVLTGKRIFYIFAAVNGVFYMAWVISALFWRYGQAHDITVYTIGYLALAMGILKVANLGAMFFIAKRKKAVPEGPALEDQ